ncbi:hypothetical protein GMRT_10106 [Giardia muris]|uniref:Dynein assembly factor 3 C-terminal domain-containing protein n=1 Tax=Giardia muris TaxID=5742 RepID=A0A4Z1SPM8_GIAMU|nr:hypothetical protein GMRT_10106 [Giardia muris]|eukprot:TNJ27756.1 hypothetical protein GMRT_10106 [Giardia muris]
MAENGVGSEQFWGLCPALRVARGNAGRLGTVLHVEAADLRYFLANLKDILGGIQGGTRHTTIFYERKVHLVTRLLLKVISLVLIGLEQDVTLKLSLAHAYAEIHGNVRISAEAWGLLTTSSTVLLAFISPHYRRKLPETLAKAYELCQDWLDLTTYLKGGDRDAIYETCRAYLRAHTAPTVTQTTIKINSFTLLEKQRMEQTRSINDAFDIRLRDFYLDRYDVRKNVCMWDKHFRFGDRLSAIHDPFFQSFRTEGVAYMRAYYRQPQVLGGTETVGPVARRAATSEESRLFCGCENPTLMSDSDGKLGFRGDIVVGPWFETCFQPYYCLSDYATALKAAIGGECDTTDEEGGSKHVLASLLSEEQEQEKFELYRTYTPSGPESFEGIFSLVEFSVFNLFVCADLLLEAAGYAKEGRFRLVFATGDFSKVVGAHHSLGGKIETVFLSLEGCRFLGHGEESPYAYERCLQPCLRPDHLLVAELGQFIPLLRKEDIPLFEQKIRRNLTEAGYKHIEACSIDYPYSFKIAATELSTMRPTHLLARKTNKEVGEVEAKAE